MTLAQYLSANLHEKFVWGVHDCVLFGAKWVKIKTGNDPLAGVSPWTTKREAAKSIREVGGLVTATDARLVRILPREAVDGDIALYNGGICLFSGAYIVGPGPAGLEFVARSKATAAWRVK